MFSSNRERINRGADNFRRFALTLLAEADSYVYLPISSIASSVLAFVCFLLPILVQSFHGECSGKIKTSTLSCLLKSKISNSRKSVASYFFFLSLYFLFRRSSKWDRQLSTQSGTSQCAGFLYSEKCVSSFFSYNLVNVDFYSPTVLKLDLFAVV